MITDWANNLDFPAQSAGLDPIIGQVAAGQDVNMREMSGLSIGNALEEFTFNRWVKAKGGEYFFVPSIPTLRDVFSQERPASTQTSKL